MRHIILISFITVLLSAFGQNPNGQLSDKLANVTSEKQTVIKYSFKIIPSSNSTWGYEIYKGEKKFIHQSNIPGMPGNNGFKTKSDAKKIAQLVVKKLRNGEIPPSVTRDEMMNLKILLTN